MKNKTDALDLCVTPFVKGDAGEKEETDYLPTDYQRYIHRSRYARWDYSKQRRETWPETVERYLDHFTSQFELTDELVTDFRESILSLEVMPSMRALMTAGKAAQQENIAMYNCSYVAVDHPKVFSEIFYILMCGTGVGYSVERQFISKLPKLHPTLRPTGEVIVVPDSRIGWAESLEAFISYLYQGLVPSWDISLVRPQGSPLKTFGGRASGGEVLTDLFRFCIKTFVGYYGAGKLKGPNRLNSLSCHDLLCKVAEVTVAGGVRRSALISLSNLSDQRMAKAKRGSWWEDNGQRALANNSVCYTEKPDLSTFMQEWMNLYESKCGERGLFSRPATERKFNEIGREYRDDIGCNPCLHPDSAVETVNGRVRIADITEPTMVYTMLDDGTLGVRRCSAAWKTKENANIYNITTKAGHVVRCTGDHKIFTQNRGWVEAQDLTTFDTLVHLKRSRRGSGYSGVGLTCNKERHQCMEHRLVWEAVNGPLPEDWDVHHIDGDTYNNSISNLEAMHHGHHSSLTRYECPNNHQITGKNEEGKQRFLPGDGSYKRPIVHMPEELKSNITNQYSARVESIVVEGKSDVYDLTVEETHNFIADFTVVHNCSEILLRGSHPEGGGQMCNLSEVVVRSGDSLDTLLHKVEIATILGTLQASQTKFNYVREGWAKNCAEEALLGVSLTGIMDHEILSNIRHPMIESWLSAMRAHARHVNEKWAEKIGINKSAAITAIKPSGTVSQLVNSASGIHPRYSKYYMRTVRGLKGAPITQFMVDQGVLCEDDVTNDSGIVFSFPIKADGKIFRDDMQALEQLEHWKLYNDVWCDHKPSITVYYRDNDFLDCGAWVYKNFDSVSGVSFLPHSDHVYQQAPYQEITESDYLITKAMQSPQDIDWEQLRNYELEDMTESSKEYACTGGACEVV